MLAPLRSLAAVVAVPALCLVTGCATTFGPPDAGPGAPAPRAPAVAFVDGPPAATHDAHAALPNRVVEARWNDARTTARPIARRPRSGSPD